MIEYLPKRCEHEAPQEDPFLGGAEFWMVKTDGNKSSEPRMIEHRNRVIVVTHIV